MTPDKREIIGGISAVMGAEMLVVIFIIIGAAVGVNVHAITTAISNWIG